jgi:hypothetical protein
MAKKSEPLTPTKWTIYKIAAKAERLGTVEAQDEATPTAYHLGAGVWMHYGCKDGEPTFEESEAEDG